MSENALSHAAAVRAAKARVVVFPELSLTGYELGAAPLSPDDVRVGAIVEACAATDSIALTGAPVEGDDGRIHIAMLHVSARGVGVASQRMSAIRPPSVSTCTSQVLCTRRRSCQFKSCAVPRSHARAEPSSPSPALPAVPVAGTSARPARLRSGRLKAMCSRVPVRRLATWPARRFVGPSLRSGENLASYKPCASRLDADRRVRLATGSASGVRLGAWSIGRVLT